MEDKLTPNQQVFINEYLIDLNATRAYKAAYPNVKKETAAASAASRLLKDVKVKAEIDKRLQKIEEESVADLKEVLKYLTAVLRNETEEEIIMTRGVGEGVSVIERVMKKISAKDRLKAAELLLKRLDMMKDDKVAEESKKIIIDLKRQGAEDE